MGRKPINTGPTFCSVDNCRVLLSTYKLYNQRCVW
jgi:hypothetical protein